MKNYNDSKVYLWLGIATLAVALFLGIVTYHSVLVVEPKAEKLLNSRENVDVNYKKAYLLLRDPHLFAGYKNFDQAALSIKGTIAEIDKRIYTGQQLEPDAPLYIEELLDRRKQGSRLGRNTMFYFLLLSTLGWIFLIIERVRAAKT